MKKFDKANELLLQIVKRYPNISPVSLDDYDLFQSFFAKEKQHTYGNTWTYVTQGVYGLGSNNLGYKYYDGENLSMFSIHPQYTGKELIVYWTRPMGDTILQVIKSFSQDILNSLGLTTYVKKIFPTQSSFLIANGFKTIDKMPWHPEAISEDDTFPEEIIDIKNTLLECNELSRKKRLRHSFIRSQNLEKLHSVKCTDFDPEDAWKVVHLFFLEAPIYNPKILSTEENYYNMIFNNPSPNLNRKVIYVDGNPVGFYLTEIGKDGITNFYATINLRKRINYLSDFAIIRVISETQTRFLNLGGSENKEMHNFKQKFKPVKENKMHWVAFT